ncbi:MAG: UDP-N-acetylmuramoyl-tripeptide--D-alanyl-D-alanine ligase [Calditrichaeota bacterium]|nr:MAG: UDP-N-acetylmuramoyl-tripeptide--D-alanyl-D-alanine ligase [Calditrichota bacterium]
MNVNRADRLYSEEISLAADEQLSPYVQMNLRKIREHRRQFDIPVVGIAGAEGKTTVRQMLSAILSPHYRLLETPPNCDTTSGVSSTILKLNETHELALIELGMVHPQQFDWAVQISAPNIGVITNIGEAHLSSMGDKYVIADAKIALMRLLPEDGYAVLNIDDELVNQLGRHARTSRIIKFGLNPNAQFYAGNIRHLGPEGMRFQVNGFYTFHMPIYGSAQIYNALAAIAVARILGLEFEAIQEGLERRFSPLPHTGNLIRKSDLYVLDYTYDATVNSVTRACESLAQFRPYSDRLILVVGNMREAGQDVVAAHRKMGYYIAALPIDVVLTIGEEARHIAEGIHQLNHNHHRKVVEICHTTEELEQRIMAHLVPRTTVLFIGSREMALNRVIGRVVERI